MELKFRFYDHKITKKMIYQGWNESKEIIFYKWETTPKCSPIMQYTGLKDKNDKEFYDGDILYCNGSTGVPLLQPYGMPAKDPREEKFIVVKLECGFVLRHITAYGKSGYKTPNCIINGWKIMNNYDLWNHQRSFDVIGNIYENPELLQ